MNLTDPGYPIDNDRFRKEVHTLTEMEVEQWLATRPPAPEISDGEDYTSFMNRQAYYTRYLNDMMLAREEFKADGERLIVMPPPVGEDIKGVVDWVQRTGDTPIEFLAKTYRSSSAKMTDRITAAKSLMDYIYRKMPQTIDVKDDRAKEEMMAQQNELLKKVEQMLSERVQEKKQLQRIK